MKKIDKETLDNDTLSLWREEGSLLIQQNFKEFRSLVAQAKKFMERGQYDAAAMYAEIAAFYAVGKHCGLFVSPELESVLSEIGQKVIPTSLSSGQSPSLRKSPKHILHVATSVMSIGGHSRMIWRWIQQDTERSHSLVLTRQGAAEIPHLLREAVNNSHGQIYVLNENIGDFELIAQAKRLREIAATADLVILHICNFDVVPLIAFANKEQFPPILFLDHADHLFWLGASISDVVISLRESGMRLAQKRRGINPSQSVLLPIILESTQRRLSRAEAKRQLGIPEESILLLSVARAIKYKTIDGISFADAHVPLLEHYERAFLIIIGPGTTEDYSSAIKQTEGRIIVYPEREDTAVFYQAADIYVDSFPFISNTSLLEAGSYGVPLVSRFPYSDESTVLGADMPGLTGNLIRTRDLEEYRKTLLHLIEDKEFRLSLGEATRKKIVESHTAGFWQKSLQKVYTLTATKPREIVTTAPTDQMFIGEPDVFLHRIDGWDDAMVDSHIQACLPVLPIAHRLQLWRRQIKKHGFGRKGRISLLLPYWLYWRLKKRKRKKNRYQTSKNRIV
jgi:glycosyltransferase involved in cell wall biosynthesis